ncbi:MAG: hypothetical protein K6E62_10460 [Lachnospiraceae bacterium]|nr:hypothetical protein [Lachnospiraceae bacterium]
MKISQKHIQYILLLLIVVIAVCAYQFGYVKYIEKAGAVKEENKGIEARINELTEKESHRTEWTESIEKADTDIRMILAQYGPGNTPEKSIMFIRSLEDAAGMTIPSVTFNPDNLIYASEDLNEDGTPKIEMNGTNLSISYNNTPYEGLKTCMDFINNYRERMNVNAFSVTRDQTSGLLAGNMVINLFSVKDADHVYAEPSVGGIEIGTDDIFGEVDLIPLEGEEAANGETIGETTETQPAGE